MQRIYFNVPKHLRHLTLATCAPESSLRYNVKHRGKYDKNTKGICGIKTYWIDIIPELNKENINTLYGGSLVVAFHLEQNHHQIYPALVAYKGSITNFDPVVKSIRIYNHLLNKDKQ